MSTFLLDDPDDVVHGNNLVRPLSDWADQLISCRIVIKGRPISDMSIHSEAFAFFVALPSGAGKPFDTTAINQRPYQVAGKMSAVSRIK